jgi:riboflavin kinase, archaea type
MRSSGGQGRRKNEEKKRRVLKVTGTVISGVGESGTFLAIPWVNNQIAEKLRFSPYCGTLNIDVHDPGVQKALKKRCDEKILPEEEGFCDALVCRGMFAGEYPCGIILPLVPHYPENVLEIVAPVHLKRALKIEDGDGVEVEIYPEKI